MFCSSYRYSVDIPVASAEKCFAIATCIGPYLPRAAKAIYVGEGGDLFQVPVRGNDEVTFRNVPSFILGVRVKAIRASGTTARDLVGVA